MTDSKTEGKSKSGIGCGAAFLVWVVIRGSIAGINECNESDSSSSSRPTTTQQADGAERWARFEEWSRMMHRRCIRRANSKMGGQWTKDPTWMEVLRTDDHLLGVTERGTGPTLDMAGIPRPQSEEAWIDLGIMGEVTLDGRLVPDDILDSAAIKELNQQTGAAGFSEMNLLQISESGSSETETIELPSMKHADGIFEAVRTSRMAFERKRAELRRRYGSVNEDMEDDAVCPEAWLDETDNVSWPAGFQVQRGQVIHNEWSHPAGCLVQSHATLTSFDDQQARMQTTLSLWEIEKDGDCRFTEISVVETTDRSTGAVLSEGTMLMKGMSAGGPSDEDEFPPIAVTGSVRLLSAPLPP